MYKNGGESSCKLKWYSPQESAIHRTETERPFLEAKGFNATSIMLLLVTCMSAILHAQFCTCMEVHLKQFCKHKISGTKNWFMKACLLMTDLAEPLMVTLLYSYTSVSLGQGVKTLL